MQFSITKTCLPWYQVTPFALTAQKNQNAMTWRLSTAPSPAASPGIELASSDPYSGRN